jgi:hypothetical protein
MILTVNRDYFIKHHQPVIFVMVKCSVFFEVRTKLLNIIQANFGYKGLISPLNLQLLLGFAFRCH